MDLLHRAAAVSGRARGYLAGLETRVETAARRVPIIGAPLRSILATANRPFAIANSVLDGQPAAKVLADQFHQQLADARDLLPWVETVVSYVPGVGFAISGAIGAAVPLAEGRPLKEATIAGIESAIPGGALAAAAFHIGRDALKKDAASLGDASLDALGAVIGHPLPDPAKASLIAGLHSLRALAHGTTPDPSVVKTAISALPSDSRSSVLLAADTGSSQVLADALVSAGTSMLPLDDVQRTTLMDAMKIGAATQQAVNLQGAVATDITTQDVPGKLAVVGASDIDDVAAAARETLRGRGDHGFLIGLGAMAHQTSAFALSAIRQKLSDDDRLGFDVALSLQVGRVVAPEPAPSVAPMAQAGYAITHGTDGIAPQHQSEILATIALTPAAVVGATKADDEIAKAKAPPPRRWWLDGLCIGGGLVVGAAIGGPPGALIGGTLGGFVDGIISRHRAA